MANGLSFGITTRAPDKRLMPPAEQRERTSVNAVQRRGAAAVDEKAKLCAPPSVFPAADDAQAGDRGPAASVGTNLRTHDANPGRAHRPQSPGASLPARTMSWCETPPADDRVGARQRCERAVAACIPAHVVGRILVGTGGLCDVGEPHAHGRDAVRRAVPRDGSSCHRAG
jgi:hypothetical protein